MNGLVQDVRYALRQLRKSPGFTIVAVLTLALGIGANMAIFSLLNAVMLKTAPVDAPEHLVVLKWSAHKHPNGDYSSYGDCAGEAGGSKPFGCSFSYPMFKKIRSKASAFSSVAAFAGPARLNLAANGGASVTNGELVSGDYFHTLGVRSALGRTLEPADEVVGSDPVVVLSYAYWTNAFGGDASVIGRTIHLNSVPFTIVGVAEPRFTRLTPGKTQDMWLPLTFLPRLHVPWMDDPENTSAWWLNIIARPKPDISVAQAQSEMDLLFRNQVLYREKPIFKEIDRPELALEPAQRALTGIRDTLAEPLYILMVVVGLVLLIACINVAGLMVARATKRAREIAVRFALGASRLRIIRQLLTESFLLSALGGAMGILFAFWGTRALITFVSAYQRTPIELDVQPDAHTLIFTACIAVFAGIALGVIPTLRSKGGEVVPALKDGTGNGSVISGAFRQRLRMGDSLVVGQVALSLMVLVVASLLVRTLVNLRSVDPGFDTHQMLLFALNPASVGYKPGQIQNLYRNLQEELASQPGIASVGYSMDAFLNGGLSVGRVRIDKQNVGTQIMPVGAGFFETLRIPLLTGRAFSPADLGAAQPPVIINQAFARRFFPNQNPIGLRIGTEAGIKSVESEIVGVVGDTKYDQLRKAEEPTVFLPIEGGPAYFEIRTTSKPSTLIPIVRRAIARLDSNLPFFDIKTQSEMVDRVLFNERLVARLSGLLAALALVLVCVGLYALLSYEVAKRTREIGIRSAMGALRQDVIFLVVGHGITLTLTGTTIGLIAAFGATRYLKSMLFEVRPTDLLTFVAAPLLLIFVALLACYIPARRAAKVDPMVALRYE